MVNTTFTTFKKFIALFVAGKIDTINDQPLTFKECAYTHTPFVDYYKQYIYPRVKDFEVLRIAALKAFRRRIIFSMIFAAFVIWLEFWYIPANQAKFNNILYMIMLGILPWFVVVYLLIWSFQRLKDYVLEVKQVIYPLIFKYFGDFNYDVKSTMTLNDLLTFGLVPEANSGYFSDAITGVYNGIKLEVARAGIDLITQTDKGTQRTPIFHGIVIKLEMNKKFSGKTVVRANLGVIDKIEQGNLMQSAMQDLSDLQKVDLEDVEFAQKFSVLATDQVEARYLLTPAFMERLLKLLEIYNAPYLHCGFFAEQFIIMIPTAYDYFNADDPFEPATFQDDINMLIDQMNHILAIIYQLQLYQPGQS